jgi:hypothetical protein
VHAVAPSSSIGCCLQRQAGISGSTVPEVYPAHCAAIITSSSISTIWSPLLLGRACSMLLHLCCVQQPFLYYPKAVHSRADH